MRHKRRFCRQSAGTPGRLGTAAAAYARQGNDLLIKPCHVIGVRPGIGLVDAERVGTCRGKTTIAGALHHLQGRLTVRGTGVAQGRRLVTVLRSDATIAVACTPAAYLRGCEALL
jgi:hypothetical protein